MLRYQILNDDKAVKSISAKGLVSIHSQFSNYAKNKGAVCRENNCLVCPFVWVLPSGSILSLQSLILD